MSTQSHIDPPVDHVSRRSVLRGGAVAGAVGLAAAAGISPALASTRPASRPAPAAAGAPAASSSPIVVYLRDAASGELEIFAGNSQVRLHDPAMAARLTRAVR